MDVAKALRAVRHAKKALQGELNDVEVDTNKGGPGSAMEVSMRHKMLEEAWSSYCRDQEEAVDALEQRGDDKMAADIELLEAEREQFQEQYTAARRVWAQCEGLWSRTEQAAAGRNSPEGATKHEPKDNTDPTQFRASPATLPKVECDAGIEAYRTWEIS